MDASALLGRLLAEKNKNERRGLLETRQRLLDAAFFQRLKERVLELALENSQEALRVAEIGLEAAEFATEQEGVA
jgi:hypothetical protein